MTFMSTPYEPMKNRFCTTIIIKSKPLKFAMKLEMLFIITF